MSITVPVRTNLPADTYKRLSVAAERTGIPVPSLVAELVRRALTDAAKVEATGHRGRRLRVDHEHRRQVRILHASGKRDREIAAVIGIAPATVAKVRSDLGLAARPRRVELEVGDTIRAMHAEGQPDRVIAAALGLHTSTIQGARERMGLPALYHGRARVAS